MSEEINKYLTEAMGEIKLLKGGVALIDKSDLKCVSGFKWTTNDRGYVVRWYRDWDGFRRCEYLHRVLMDFPSETVDHINNDRLDNRRLNLRVCSIAQNNHNRPPNKNKMYSDYKGVTFDKRRNNYVAQIMHKGKNIYLGAHTLEIDAVEAYNEKAYELFGEYAYLNEVIDE